MTPDPANDEQAWADYRATVDELARLLRSAGPLDSTTPPIDLSATKIVGHIAVPAELLADATLPPFVPRPERRRDRWRRIAIDTAALAAFTIAMAAARVLLPIYRRIRR